MSEQEVTVTLLESEARALLAVSEHRTKIERRFAAKIRENPSGCWLWLGSVKKNGYGRFKFNGKTQLAHRVVHELLIGPIPEGLTIDHLCRNRACVNPAHLEAVTGRVNSLRGDSEPARNARKTHCKHGHPFDAANTYRNPNTGRRVCRTCDRLYQRKIRAALREVSTEPSKGQGALL